MKRGIGLIISALILLNIMPMHILAEETDKINAVIEVDADKKIISVAGNSTAKEKSVSIYFLYPGKKISDVKAPDAAQSVYSYIGQSEKIANGAFYDEFRYRGEPGMYTLCLKNGECYKEYSVDTTQSSTVGQLFALKSLPTSYKAINAQTTQERLLAAQEETGDEMPQVMTRVPSGSRTVFVSAHAGGDAADGSFEHPFSSLSSAIKSLGGRYSDTVIYLRGGDYSYKEFGELNNVYADEKNPLYISAYDNETVSVVGGEIIAAESFKPISQDDEKAHKKLDKSVTDKIRYVDLKELGINEYGNFSPTERPMLNIDGRKYEIARWPDGNGTVMRKYIGDDGENGVIDSGPITTGVGSEAGGYRTLGKYGEKGFEIQVESVRPFTWEDTGNIWMYGSFYKEWTKDHVKIKSFNPSKRSVRTYSGQSWGAMYDEENAFYYYNVFEELTSPGEWFLDSESGKLYVYPIEGHSGKNAVLSLNGNDILTLKNCGYININGIKFSNAKNSAVTVRDSEGIVLQNCDISNCGGNAVNINGLSKYNGVISSVISDCGGDAFSIVMANEVRDKLIPQRNFLQNSYVYNCRAVRTHGVGNIVSHNVVSNSIGTAMYINQGCENVYEYNEVYSSPREIEDAGGIYINGNNFSARGNHVRYNYVHDTDGDRKSIFVGIYLDDMVSGCFVYGNIVENALIFSNGGSENAVVNNIIVNPIKAGKETRKPDEAVKWSRGYMINDTRWISGALKKGSFASYLKYDFIENDVWKNRYPSLYDFSQKMKLRISEYEQNGKILSDINVNFKKGEILDGDDAVVYPSDDRTASGRFDVTNEITDLDTYLRSPKNNYIAQNFMVNALDGGIYETDIGSRTVVKRNNYNCLDENNPLGEGYSDKSVYDGIREYIKDFENIPFSDIGIWCGNRGWSELIQLGTPSLVSPFDKCRYDAANQIMDFEWTSVPGAGTYTLQISADPNFSNILYEKTVYGMKHSVKSANVADAKQTYYWRVIAESLSDKVSGKESVSDIYEFSIGGEDIKSKRGNSVAAVGVNASRTGGKQNAEMTVCNSLDEDISVKIYAAFYKDNFLSDIQTFDKTVKANDFSDKISAASDKAADEVKFFIWENDASIRPAGYFKQVGIK